MQVIATEASKALDLKGHTLVVPGCGGVAHLAELSVDALITTYGLSRVAIVESRHLLPVAMPSAWADPACNSQAASLTTAAELYQGTEPGISVLQMRSAVREGRRQALSREVLSWAREMGVAKVLVLSSCSSHVKRDADLSAGSELRYALVGSDCESLKADAAVLPLGHSVSEEELRGSADGPAAAQAMLRGSGLARTLLMQAAESSGLSVHCIACFANEILDWRLPEQLSRAACRYIAASAGGEEKALVQPPSWALALKAMMAPPVDLRLW
eukprot:TRINITY_DN11977_c0_g1_i1.p1 TRINITY_DN11977_c0_g1~~TRINITY_DN11977_c0_g1_i1.p1  ORF type:complete len:287 (+),score=81.03 TRINITY_DN11977_c0_g1_i1:48-863(+)